MLKLNSLMLFSPNPEKLSDFYAKVFDKKHDWEDGGYYGFKSGDFFLTIGSHDKITDSNPQPERMMINFETEDVKGEFARIKEAANPKVVAEPYNMDREDAWIATFEDIDGNFFQLVSPFDM